MESKNIEKTTVISTNMEDWQNLVLTFEIEDPKATIDELIHLVAAGKMNLSYKELLATITAINDIYVPRVSDILYPDSDKHYRP